MAFNNRNSSRNFDEMFWSKDYPTLRSIFQGYDAIDPFPLLNVKDNNGLTAMNFAIRTNNDPTFKCLRALMEISFVRLRDNKGGTFFHEICDRLTCSVDKKLIEEILKKLIDYGVSKDAKDSNGKLAYEASQISATILKELTRTDPNDDREPVQFSYKKLAGQLIEEIRSNFLTLHKSLSTIPGTLESLLKSGEKSNILETMKEIPKTIHKFFEVCGFDESIVDNEQFYSRLKETTSRLLKYNYENFQSHTEIVRDINSLFEQDTGLIDQLSKKLHDMKFESLNAIASLSTTTKPRGSGIVSSKQKANSKQGAKQR